MSRSQVISLIRLSRVYAAERMPWFANALFTARLVVTDACPALAAVDQQFRVYFNPDLCAKLIGSSERCSAVRQLAFVWIHEINHVLRDHARRAREGNAAPDRWNIAADLEINDSDWADLLPPVQFPPLLPRQFGMPNGKLAEFYYHSLPTERSSTESARMHEVPQVGVQDEGSGVHGQSRKWEVSSEPDAGECEGVSLLVQEHLRREICEAVQRDKHRGDVPQSLVRWSNLRLNPQVDWRKQLRRYLRRVATSAGRQLDYSYQRPHRRSSQFAPILRPRLETYSPPHIACVVDTSGSMSPDELGRALSEVWAVLSAVRGPITVIPCDSVAHEPVQLTTKQSVALLCTRLRGGGGTDMRAGVNAARELQPKPAVIIVLTDGYTPYPTVRGPTPTLFGIFTSPTRRGAPPLPPMPPWTSRDVILIDADHRPD